MKNMLMRRFARRGTGLITGLVLILLLATSASAGFDDIIVGVNGDTTATEMTQGDELFWGASCDTGATINFEIWFDVNGNSSIDPTVDAILTSENITDGNAVTEPDPILDGYALSSPFVLSGEPGEYIFRVKDVATDSLLIKSLDMIAMSSPPNQFTGQISLPGIGAPNSLLAGRVVFAEADIEAAGAVLGITDNMGEYSMNIPAAGTGIEFYLGVNGVNGFVSAGELSATASGVVSGLDFAFTAATDSVYGFVKDETGTVLNFETDVEADSDYGWRRATTRNGRYAIYFDASDYGEWEVEQDGRLSPLYLFSPQYTFDLDTVGSFEQDIVVTRSNAQIYARILENGGLPVNNYRVDAYSDLFGIGTESVSGTGSDNIVALHVTTLDPDQWSVYIASYSDEYPIPPPLAVTNSAFGVSPGDTVTLELISGYLVSGTLTQDPGDAPIDWDDVWVGAGVYGDNPDDFGVYSFYADTGIHYMGAFSDFYLANPQTRIVHVTADTSGGLGFVVNRRHCNVTGTLTGVTLPLSPFNQVLAFTGSNDTDGYYAYGAVDPNTGMYSLDLCDGNWTIHPPAGLPGLFPPANVMITIGESPDTVRTVNFAYTPITGCCVGATGNVSGDAGDAVDVTDLTKLVNHLFLTFEAIDCMAEGNMSGDAGCAVDVSDLTILVNHLFLTFEPLAACNPACE